MTAHKIKNRIIKIEKYFIIFNINALFFFNALLKKNSNPNPARMEIEKLEMNKILAYALKLPKKGMLNKK